MSDKQTLYCSFCGKSQHEIRKLIAGPKAFICNECVDLCYDIVWENKPQTSLAKFEWFFKQKTSLDKFQAFLWSKG